MRKYLSSWFNDLLLTSEKAGLGRLKVDSQQTGFESNHQFRFFDEMEIPKTTGSQIVYYVQSVNPFVLFNRIISFYQSGATYRVYSDDGTHTFTGTLGDPVRAFPVNSDLSDSGLDAHPESTITLSKASGNGIFVNGSDPRTGTSCRAGTNSAQSSGALALDSVRLGFRAGFTGWLVFTVVPGAADAALGEFELLFEERY